MTDERLDPVEEQLLDPIDDRKISRSRAAEWIWWGILSLVLLLVSVAGFSAAAAVSPRFCALCHSSAMENLAQSPHKGVNCDGCHRDSGIFGLAENRLWVASMVIEAPYRAVFPSKAQPNVDRERCIGCHRRQLAVTSVSNGVRMNHDAPVDEGWSCQRCHRDIAHGAKGRVRASYSMGTCLGCHSTGQTDASKCVTCHPEGQSPTAVRVTQTAWNVTHGPNWQKTHGMGDLKTCRTCHAETYCSGCHAINLPHPETYLSIHGQEYEQFGDKSCMTCHQKSSCDACHGGVEMPHPPAFLSKHKKTVAKTGKASCMRCHEQSSCDDCHSRHTHPGLTPKRLKELKSRPVRVQ